MSSVANEGAADLRRALRLVSDVVTSLPETESFLLGREILGAFRELRVADPETYLVFRQRIRERSGRAVVELLDSAIGSPPRGPLRELRLQRVQDLLEQRPATWTVEGVLPERGLGVAFGDAGSGKTTFLFELAGSIVTGAPFFGRDTAPGGALIISAEGRLRDRLDGYMKHNGLAVEDLRLLRVIEDVPDLSGDTVDLDRLVAHIRAFRETVGVVQLVGIDTLARVLAGADENTADGMGRFLRAAREIEDAAGGVVLVNHHSGKDSSRGARGHSSLRAAADAELEILRDGDVRRLRLSKLRDGPDGLEFGFRLETVDLGDGRTACVIVPDGSQPSISRRVRPLTPDERVALDALREEIAASGSTLGQATSEIPAGKAYVTVDAWRQRFHARLGESREADARRQAWRRARSRLVADRRVGCWNDYAWIWERDRDTA